VLCAYSSSPIFTNCTLSGNTANNYGGGIYCSSSSLIFTNCILWNDSPQEIYSSGSSVTVTYSDIQGGYAGAGNINSDPLFVNSDVGDFHLTRNSPCVDTGSNQDAPGDDKDGIQRPQDGDANGVATCDMGAYECTAPLFTDLNEVNGDVRIKGMESGDRMGFPLGENGDINGDGIDDMVIGNYYEEKVFIIYGSASLPETIDLSTTPPSITIHRQNAYDKLECSSASLKGDVNGDGINDIILGAYGADPSGRSMAGKGYVIYGGDTLPENIYLSTTPADITIYGANSGDYLGNKTISGDINGDGIDDIILTAPKADPGGRSEAGKAYIIYGNTNFPSNHTIDLRYDTADFIVWGDDASGRLGGRPICSGDINGDGMDDILLTASKADPGGRSDAGEAYVIYGSATLSGEIDLHSTIADINIYGKNSGDQLGYGISTGDINGDGKYDIILGAYAADPGGVTNAGEVYVIYGDTDLPVTIDLNSDPDYPDCTIQGAGASDYLGYWLSSGDINNDHKADIIMGTPYVDPEGRGTAGATYLIYGKTILPSMINLGSAHADITVYGDHAGDYSGISVSSADINGDDNDDILIGAYAADPGGRTDAGETYVIYGL